MENKLFFAFFVVVEDDSKRGYTLDKQIFKVSLGEHFF